MSNPYEPVAYLFLCVIICTRPQKLPGPRLFFSSGNISCIATLTLNHDITESVLPPKKLEKWWIHSNGSTSIPRLLEKLGMMLKGRVLSKSCPLCFPNQYTGMEERFSVPQPESWKSFI